MKISGNDIRPGNVVEHKGELWQAVKIQHTQPGKGGAYLQVELKGLTTHSKLNERFRSSETVEKVRLEMNAYQVLFIDGDTINLMDNESFEQIPLPTDLAGDAAQFLADGMTVEVESYEGRYLRVELPETVILEISETEPTVKGQTAASSFKPAILENGVRVMVPPFVGTGEKIVVNTTDGTYVRRAED
jgi:elongation factor P